MYHILLKRLEIMSSQDGNLDEAPVLNAQIEKMDKNNKINCRPMPSIEIDQSQIKRKTTQNLENSGAKGAILGSK